MTGLDGLAALRPEAVQLGEGSLHAVVQSVNFLGATTRVALMARGVRLTALLPHGAERPEPGQEVTVGWDREDLWEMRA
jgi:ABC-type Fe3+/spermidine/putrescine transport system ATPase subunit